MLRRTMIYIVNILKELHMKNEKNQHNKRAYTCCFTGHRDIPQCQREDVENNLVMVLEKMIKEGVIYFGVGGALGFDTLAAQTVIKLREKYPAIKLILVLPCKSQADRWRENDRMIYEEIKRRSDKVVYTSIDYTRDCMFKRNRHLVDCSGVCICYLTERTGGTAYTVNYAKKKSLRIINLAELPDRILEM